MTATSPTVKMAACLPQDGDLSNPDKPGSTSNSQSSKQPASCPQGGALALSATSAEIKLEGDKAYDEVANYNEEDLRSLLEEVTNASKRKNKNTLSPYALALILKEQDALREESSSGDDTRDLAYRRRNKKSLVGRRDQSNGDQSAAARTSTGGSLGSLHDLSETKQPKKVAGPNQGVASRCREGGSCGNLSRGSFETVKRKGRRPRDAARASTSQREGGSLQNLNKTEAASNDSKKLHKSGSLSQVCSEVAGGARSKNRRQKTASESSSCRYSRRSEDREAGEESSGDEAIVDNRCRLLAQSPHATEHTFPPEGVGGASGGIDPDISNNVEDSMSDVASAGETTEEEDDPREETRIELQNVTCHRADFDNSHTEVDKAISFSLGRSQEDTMLSSCGRRTLPLQDSQCVTSVFKEEKLTNKGLEEEGLGKRKLLASRSDSGGSENKSSLDENGNPVMSTSSSCVVTPLSASERSNALVMQTHHTARKNVMNNSHKDASRFDRVKARNDKKKANKEKDIVNIKETPGFRGDQDLNDILKFLGAEIDSTNGKNKKKHKGKKDDNREDKEGKKKIKNSEKYIEDNNVEKGKSDDGRWKVNEGSSTVVGEVSHDNNRRSREREEEKKVNNNKKNKNNDKKTKKDSSNLRESSSVEDLVSKCRQSDSVRDIRKQVTVDDGDMPLTILNTYHNNKKVDKMNNVIPDGPYIKEPVVVDIINDNEINSLQVTSDFAADFYSAGDSFLTTDVSHTPSSPSGGDFEVVSNKKKSKRYKNGPHMASLNLKSGGSDKVSSNRNTGSSYSDDGIRCSRFVQSKANQRSSGGYERPHINFMEGPRTAHENFWAQLGVGDRYGGERYTATTTSAPHSEDSGSDGDDSVHSMPVPSITPRPDVRKPPPSSDSTPQASYANIAKLAASANRAQMKRMSPSVGQPGTVVHKELEVEQSFNGNVEQSDSKPPVLNESRPNILDDNFPSLAESLGGIGPPSSISALKSNDVRTNPSDNVMQSGSISVVHSLDHLKETITSDESNCGQRENIEHALLPITGAAEGAAEDKRPIKFPIECVSSPSSQAQQFQQTSVQPQDQHHHSHQIQQQHPQIQPNHHHQISNTQQQHQHTKHQNIIYQQNTHQTAPLQQPVPHSQYQRQNFYPHSSSPQNSLHTNHQQKQTQQLSQQPQPSLPFAQNTQQKQHLPQTIQPQYPKQPLQNPQPQQNVHLQSSLHSQQTAYPQSSMHSQPSLQSHQSHIPQQNENPQLNPHSQQIAHPRQNVHLQSVHSQQNTNPQQNSNPQQNNLHLNSHSQTYSPQSNSLNQPISPRQQNLRSPPNPHSQQNSHPQQSSYLQQSPKPLQNSQPQLITHPQQSSHPQRNSQSQQSMPPQLTPNQEQTSQPEQNMLPEESSVPLFSSANGLLVGDASEDKQSLGNKSQGKQTKNGSVAPSVQSGDTSRMKKLEPAVVFTDNAKFNHSVSGIEFGFGFDEPIVTTSDTDVRESSSCVLDNEDSNCNNNHLLKNNMIVAKDFSKWFKAPKNDKINYNYEELIRHVSKEWVVTLRLMEEDPKNIQYWRAAASTEEA
ncbi:uncharacterized protein [Cherax quadricarinatus]